ncbi:DUF3800 domain-containing protein [Bacillus cereus]|uniref:DUF3800 domain-containing protein n=1 Tax=Bacillus cereus TaxID=1396 RepID=UPI00123AEAA5|nr:DUF3800 domain-containing protein [Bacillus cereus]KAA6472438.1 DUF3800 domain-containing protein [Bacillus cereus]
MTVTDYSITREEMINMYRSLDPTLDFNINYNFYYDETNNCRTLRIKNGQLNAHKDKDFVLGGVVVEQHNEIGIENSFWLLREKFKFQPSLKEVKFKNICPDGSDFLKCIRNKKLHDFLNWLLEKDIFIHFSMLDHLYYSIIDIVDCLDVDSSMDRDIKTFFYHFIYTNTDEFIRIFDKYNYPNVGATQGPAFYTEIIDCVRNIKTVGILESIWKEMLLNVLKGGVYKEPIFLINNEDKTLIKEYYGLYLERIQMFENAFHTFDEELEVQKELNKFELNTDKQLPANYKFIKSESNIFTQLSDVIVGILGRFFEFIKRMPMNKVLDDNFSVSKHYSFDKHQQIGFDLLIELLQKSYQKNGAFRKMSGNNILAYKFEKIIDIKNVF